MCRVLHQQGGRSVRDPTSSFARHSNMLLEQERNRHRLKTLFRYSVCEKAARMLSSYATILNSCVILKLRVWVRKYSKGALLLFSFISLTLQLQYVDWGLFFQKRPRTFRSHLGGAKPQSNYRKTRQKLSLNGLKHTSWLCTHNNNNTHLSHIITQSEPQCHQACFQLSVIYKLPA